MVIPGRSRGHSHDVVEYGLEAAETVLLARLENGLLFPFVPCCDEEEVRTDVTRDVL